MDPNVGPEEKKTILSTFMKHLWVIPIACFVIQLLSIGTNRGNGLIFVALREEEDTGRFQASLPFAMPGASAIAMAPLLGFLGPRMTFFGKFCSGIFLFAMGHILCFFSTNMYVVIVFFGFVKGCGMTILNLTVQELILTTFQENKATAMGIASLGNPVGGVFWPYLIHFFLEEYGPKGTFLLNAGVSLHSLIAIVILWAYGRSQDLTDTLENGKITHGNEHHSEIVKSQNESHEKQFEINEASKKHRKSCNFQSNDQLLKTPEEGNISAEMKPSINSVQTELKNQKRNDSSEVVNDSGQPAHSRFKILTTVITSRGFYLITLTRTMNMVSQTTVNQVTVDYMMDKGIEKSIAISMLTIFALGGIFGRVSVGWIADRKILSDNVMIAVVLSAGASVLLAMTLMHNLYCLQISFLLLGLFQSASQIVNTVKYSAYFQKHETLIALSASRFIQGFVQLFRFPLMGCIRDLLGTYDYIYLFMSIVLFLVALIWFWENFLETRKTKKYQKLSTEEPTV